jgi:hypothetical protein
MKNLQIQSVLVILTMLFIGTLSPSDGVDTPLDKSPLEMLITAATIVVLASLVLLALKKKSILSAQSSINQ